MGDVYPRFKAAAVMAAPVFLYRDATTQKACGLIAEAAGAGAKLSVFKFLPCITRTKSKQPCVGRSTYRERVLEPLKRKLEAACLAESIVATPHRAVDG